MSASLDDVKDFDYIISEASRIDNEMNSSNFKQFYEKEYNRPLGSIGMTINPPSEPLAAHKNIHQRQIHLSYAANEKFYEIAARFIKSHKLQMLVTIEELVTNIKKSFYIHIFIDDGGDGAIGYTQLLNKSLKLTKKEMTKEEFYFPLLAHGCTKERVSIGCTEIISVENMYSRIGNNLTPDQLSIASKFCAANKYPYEHFLRIPISKRSKKS
ncbi:hypothetical protein [Leclercia tamurae]|uniref:hypothetical protein n=1 Tax=Leclercia tamurae TaxID=2926467 RepID=UPI0036F48328